MPVRRPGGNAGPEFRMRSAIKVDISGNRQEQQGDRERESHTRQSPEDHQCTRAGGADAPMAEVEEGRRERWERQGFGEWWSAT